MMTGNPNQQSRPNIFGDDFNYPAPNTEWNRFASSASVYSQPNFPFCSNYGSEPVKFPLRNSHEGGYGDHLYNPFNFPSASSSHQFNFSNDESHIPLRFKRKTESPTSGISKQHITEEKMAEHMSKLHISSETSMRNEPEESRKKRLYLCEELRKLQTESILPASLVNKIQRPCTALVLWQPPQRVLPIDNDNSNNNNDQVPDNNLMEFDSR